MSFEELKEGRRNFIYAKRLNVDDCNLHFDCSKFAFTFCRGISSTAEQEGHGERERGSPLNWTFKTNTTKQRQITSSNLNIFY